MNININQTNTDVVSKSSSSTSAAAAAAAAVLSQPFNGSKQVQAISEIFKPDVVSQQTTQFDRLHINQLSTKSQPGDSLYRPPKELLTRGTNEPKSTVSSSSTSSSVSSVENTAASTIAQKISFFNNGNLQQQHQHQQRTCLILPHPAQV